MPVTVMANTLLHRLHWNVVQVASVKLEWSPLALQRVKEIAV